METPPFAPFAAKNLRCFAAFSLMAQSPLLFQAGESVSAATFIHSASSRFFGRGPAT